MTTRFDQLKGHPQAIRKHKIKITTASLILGQSKFSDLLLQLVRNVMAHGQKPDFVFPPNGRFHLNRWGRQFSRLLAAELWASA